MDIELQPPTGFTGLTLGLPEDETARQAEAFGPVKISRGAPVQAGLVTLPGLAKMVVGSYDFDFVLTFAKDGAADTVELWRPPDPAYDVTVRFEGIDVFRTPWTEVLTALEDRGHRIVREDELFAYAPDLTLGFNRDTAHEVPKDADDLPLYFESILVAEPGYYDGPGGF